MIKIGIDPGTHTGVAVWDCTARKFRQVTTTSLPRAFDIVQMWTEIKGRTEVQVVIEDARLRKWIPRYGELSRTIGRAQGAGSVKRDSAIWEEYCALRGLTLIKQPPTKGATKWTADTFATLTGWGESTNEHGRDAALLVWMR